VTLADTGGYFTATDVEGALAEHVSDTVDAHDASAISVTSTDLATALKLLRLSASAERNSGALTVMAVPPTVTYAISNATLARVWPAQGADQDNIVGTTTATYNIATGKIQNAGKPMGHEFDFYGQNVEFGWIAETSSTTVWIWVDGQPLTTGPVAPTGVTISAGTAVWGKLAFGAAGWHRVTVWINLCNAIMYNATDVGGVIIAAPQRPRIGIVGDSFTDSSNGVSSDKLNSFPTQLRILLGAEVGQLGVGGTGYVSGGASSFGAASRVAQMVEFKPDIMLFVGSVNDDSSFATVGAAATACWTAYAAALPGVPIIVFGPQPSNNIDTVGTNRAQANAAIRTAALAHTAVNAFHDMLGNAATGTVPGTWSAGTTYQPGDLAVYQGSIWKYSVDTASAHATAPSQSGRWTLQSAAYTGTGQVGTTTGDGNRDVFLYSDGIHPTILGSQALGRWICRRLFDTAATIGLG
jgi:hypothetical protein